MIDKQIDGWSQCERLQCTVINPRWLTESGQSPEDNHVVLPTEILTEQGESYESLRIQIQLNFPLPPQVDKSRSFNNLPINP